jgi:hypothetical protein
MHRRRLAVLVGLVAPLASAAGCSLINAYDAVKEAPGDDAAGDDVTGDDVTSGADGTVASEAASSGGGGEASGDGTSTGTGDGTSEAMTAPPEAAVDAGSPAGAIVIGGHTTTTNPTTGKVTTYVLAVLDPATGALKNQSNMAVGGVAYDPNFDLWYIFDNGASENSISATQGVPITLHVRQLDTRPGGTWAWTELATVSVPPIFSGQQISVLVDRLAYVSYAPTDGSTFSQLTVIDTTNFGTATPDAGAPISSTLLPTFPNGPVGMTGAPALVSVGGTLALLQNTSTGTAAGQFDFITAVVNGSGTTVNGSETLPVGSAPNLQVAASCGTSIVGGQYGFLLAAPSFNPPPDGGVNGGSLTPWTVGNMSGESLESMPGVVFPGTGTRLNPVIFATCSQFAIVTEGLVPPSDLNYMFILPLNGAAPDGGFPGFPLQQVTSVSSSAFEPYTNTIVATGATVGFILGFQLSASGGPPSLANRAQPPLSNWSPPADLVASWIAVRQPQSFQCPP